MCLSYMRKWNGFTRVIAVVNAIDYGLFIDLNEVLSGGQTSRLPWQNNLVDLEQQEECLSLHRR